MVKEVRECLANLDTDFPQLKGLKTELCGFVWFQGWNDMCQPGDKIRQQVYDEYCPNFVHLVQDLRAEFKVPNLPVVMGELGVGGEKADKNMMDFRAATGEDRDLPGIERHAWVMCVLRPSGIPSWMNCPGKWNLKNIG